MQLACESMDVDAAIRELERALPLVALQNIIQHRIEQHKQRGALRRRLEMLRAVQIAEEV